MRISKSAGDMQNLTAQIRRGAEQIKRQEGQQQENPQKRL